MYRYRSPVRTRVALIAAAVALTVGGGAAGATLVSGGGNAVVAEHPAAASPTATPIAVAPSAPSKQGPPASTTPPADSVKPPTTSDDSGTANATSAPVESSKPKATQQPKPKHTPSPTPPSPPSTTPDPEQTPTTTPESVCTVSGQTHPVGDVWWGPIASNDYRYPNTCVASAGVATVMKMPIDGEPCTAAGQTGGNQTSTWFFYCVPDPDGPVNGVAWALKNAKTKVILVPPAGGLCWYTDAEAEALASCRAAEASH